MTDHPPVSGDPYTAAVAARWRAWARTLDRPCGPAAATEEGDPVSGTQCTGVARTGADR